jgi:hypothetical protein
MLISFTNILNTLHSLQELGDFQVKVVKDFIICYMLNITDLAKY